MRAFAVFLACFCFAALAGCSREVAPPAGRWEGAYTSTNAIIVARMEITGKGEIFVSAPNAENIGSAAAADRAAIRERLAADLAQGWDSVAPHSLDFDGKTFRKPGGIAPQAEWDSSSKQMTLIVYLGKGAGIRIPLRNVKTFSANPFAGA
jgi:hypothetical protein